MPKTNAENCRNYRIRKQDPAKKRVPSLKSSTERSRAHRLRKKLLKQAVQLSVDELSRVSSTSKAQTITLESPPQPVASVTNSNHPRAAVISSHIADYIGGIEMPKTNAEKCKDYYERNKLEKQKKAAERVRAYRLRQKTMLQENESSIGGNVSVLLNPDMCGVTPGTVPPPGTSRNETVTNNIVNQIDDSAFESTLCTVTYDNRNIIYVPAKLPTQNNPSFSNRLAVQSVPATGRERTRQHHPQTNIQQISCATNTHAIQRVTQDPALVSRRASPACDVSLRDRVNEKKKQRQQRYREQNREKLKQREAERRKLKENLESAAKPSSNINEIDLNHEEITNVNLKCLSGLEETQPLIVQGNEHGEVKNALQKKRERQQRYREQNRDKLKQREAARRHRQQNLEIVAASSTALNEDCTEVICEAVVDEVHTNSLSVADVAGTQNVFGEINERESPSSTRSDIEKPSTSEQNYSNDPVPIKLEINSDSSIVYCSQNAEGGDDASTEPICKLDAYDRFALSLSKKIKSIHAIAGRIRLMNALQDLVNNFCAKNAHDPDTASNFTFLVDSSSQQTPYVTGGMLNPEQGMLQPQTVLAGQDQTFQQGLLQPRLSQIILSGQSFQQMTQAATPATVNQPIHVQQITIDPKPNSSLNVTHEKKMRKTPAKRRKATEPPANTPTDDNYVEVPVATTLPTEFVEIKVVKTYAQRQKEYRLRKKIEKERLFGKRVPKTNAQNQKKFREKQKIIQNEALNLARKKSNAERAKRYRDKLKSKKQHSKLDYLLSSKEDSIPSSLSPKPDGAGTDQEARPQIDILEIKEEKIQDYETSATTVTTENQPEKQSMSGITFINDPIPIKMEIVEDMEDF